MAGLDDLSLDQLQALKAAQSGASGDASTPSTNGVAPVDAIHQIESGSASDSASITNPASGAQGSMQVMPKTAMDPGYGVKPSNGTPEDNARAGREYYAALQNKYGDPTTAAIAYNWGPGNTDKWIKNGQDLNALPLETLKYIKQFNTLTGAGQAQQPQQGQAAQQLPYTPMSQFNQTVAPQQQSSTLKGLAGGIGEGFGDTVLGAQALAGKGLTAIGMPNAGNWLVNDAQAGKANLAQQAGAYNSPTAEKIGNVIGATAPMLAGGISLPAQLATGAAYGGSQAALNGSDILPGTIEGAGLGAAGYAGGKVLGAAIQPLQPVIDNLGRIFQGGQNTAVANIAKQLGPDADSVAQNLANNSNEIIPGSLPTAADAANNPIMARIQRQANNTAAGQAAFPARFADNNAARLATGDQVVQPAVGPGLDAETQAFANNQAGLLTAGQGELPPVSDAVNQSLQNNAGISALNAARATAGNAGDQVFDTQAQGVQQALAQGIQGVSGTPQTLAALKAARSVQSADDFLATNVTVPSSVMQGLTSRPTFRAAMVKAQRQMADANMSIYASDQDEALAAIGNTRAQFNGRYLQQVKQNLDDFQSSKIAAGQNNDARLVGNLKNDFVQRLDDNIPGYKQARDNYAQASAPINAQQALQQRLNGAVDPVTQQVSPGRLSSTINGVVADQARPGFRPADSVTPDQIQALQALGSQARAAPTNIQGLPGQGQEYLRQALQSNAGRGGSELVKSDSQNAANAFNDYLSQSSPSYKAYLEQQAGRGADLQSRQTLGDALNKARLAGNNASGDPVLSFNAAKQIPQLTGGAEGYRQALVSDLQRATTPNASLGAAGSQTAANQQLAGGILGRFLNHRISDAGIGAAVGTGNFAGAAVGFVVQKAFQKATARTEQATIDLLLNPKKLSRALQDFKTMPEKTAFIDGLKAKAAVSSAAGARAVQSYESRK